MKEDTRRWLMAAAMGGLGALLAGAFNAALGQSASLHDIPWYMAHGPARAATLKVCRNDHAFARMPDCANAESAENRLWAQRAVAGIPPGGRAQPGRGARPSTPDNFISSPQWWADNRLARAGALAACKNPVTIYTPETCAAARQGDALDTARRGGRP